MRITETIIPIPPTPPRTFTAEATLEELQELLKALEDDRQGAASPLRLAMYEAVKTALA